MKEKLLKLLYKSFEVKLTGEEQRHLENALESFQFLQEEKRNIEQLRHTISNSGKNSFSPFFAEKIMQRIENPIEANSPIDDFLTSLLWSFRRVAIAGGVVVLLLLINNFITNDSVSVDAALSYKQMSIEDVWSFNDLISETLK